jgi:hypothetical protein
MKINMFTICLAGVLFSGVSLFAQDSDGPEETTETFRMMLQLYQELDTSHDLRTGFLMDKALWNSENLQHKGSLRDRKTDKGSWYQMYLSAYRAQTKKNTGMLPLDSIKKKAGNYIQKGLIPIMGLSLYYDQLKPEALLNGSLLLDTTAENPILRISKQAENPFKQDSVFMMTVAVDRWQITGEHVGFIAPSSLFFSNDKEDYTSMNIKINEGEWMPFSFDEPFYIPSSFFRRNDVNDTFWKPVDIYFNIEVHPGFFKYSLSSTDWHIFHPDSYDGGIENITAKRLTGPGEVYGMAPIILGENKDGRKHTCITKPVIFVEGIDFGTVENPRGCSRSRCGNLGLVDLMFPSDSGTFLYGPDLINQLKKGGYDIIYLDFHDGATDIQDNAMVLMELIQYVNAIKCSQEELVIIGASMGGIVTKYALSYMENLQIEHCVRSFVSFDVPHRGANIPLGLQFFLDENKNLSSEAKDQLEHQLKRPATMQLLSNYYGSKDLKEHDKRTSLLSELEKMGNYPRKTRNTAIINGTLEGITQPFNAGDNMLSLFFYENASNYTVKVFALCGNGTDKRLYESNLTVLGIRIKRVEKYAPKNGCIPYDNAPGGFREGLYDEKHFSAINLLSIKNLPQSFIPSISALDIPTQNLKIRLSDVINPNSPYQPPFAAYHVPEKNESHVQITFDRSYPTDVGHNIGWLMNELQTSSGEPEGILSRHYNYAQPNKQRMKGLTVPSGIRLHINGHYASDYGIGPHAIEGSTVVVYKNACSDPNVVISGGATLEIGDNNGRNQNKGVLYIGSGSSLQLYDGAQLTIHNGSRLIIEKGGTLELFGTPTIHLSGDNAGLIMEGQIIMHPSARLEIQSGMSGATGFLSLVKNSGGPINPIVCLGRDNEITLQGRDQDNTVLIISGGDMVFPHSNNLSHHLQFFKLVNAGVSIGDQSSLEVGSAMALHHVRFGPAEGAVQTVGLKVLGQPIMAFKDVLFENLSTGLDITGRYGQFNQVIDATFNRCNMGIKARETSLFVKDGAFYGNDVAIQQESRIFRGQNEYRNCLFIQNRNGVMYASPDPLFLNENTFAYQNKAIDFNYTFMGKTADLVMQCVKVIGCETGVELGALNRLNMSTTTLFDQKSGGHNSFYLNKQSIKLHGYVGALSELYLDNGYNNFIGEKHHSRISAPYQFVDGLVSMRQLGPTGALPASHNYWQPHPGNNIQSGGSDYFQLSTFVTGLNPAPAFLDGSTLQQPNFYCFVDPEELYWSVPEFLHMTESPAPASYDVIRLYPNPTHDALYVESSLFSPDQYPMNDAGIVSVRNNMRIYNSIGKEMNVPVEIMSGKCKIDTRQLSAGTYYLQLNNGHQTHKKTFIVVH